VACVGPGRERDLYFFDKRMFERSVVLRDVDMTAVALEETRTSHLYAACLRPRFIPVLGKQRDCAWLLT
jgi:hypothetical protein